MARSETPPPDDDTDDDDQPGEEPGEGGDRPGGTDDERLAQRIERTVRSVLGGLLGGGSLDVADDHDTPPEEEPAPARRSAAAVEDDMESRVRRALDSIRSDEDKEDRMKKLEETVFAEKPPVKQRRLERAMWGPPRGG